MKAQELDRAVIGPNAPGEGSAMVYLARHGETAWSLTGQHTGLTDLPLTQRGERNALRLGRRLASLRFTQVFTSPLQRARRTCELAGFGTVAQVDDNLVEWNYGEYEGLRTEEIRAKRPGWQLFCDGCPGGETPAQIAERADRTVNRLRPNKAKILVFSSAHFLRVLAVRWLGLDVSFGRFFLCCGVIFAESSPTGRPYGCGAI